MFTSDSRYAGQPTYRITLPEGSQVLAVRPPLSNPQPLVGYTDTRFLVENIVKQPGQYSWQLMNWKIAAKELAVSGSDFTNKFVQAMATPPMSPATKSTVDLGLGAPFQFQLAGDEYKIDEAMKEN